MKATCCLLIYNLELVFAIVDLNVPCLCYEIPNNPSNICIWCHISHLRRFTNDPWCEAPFEDIFICFFYALFSLHCSLSRPLLFLDLFHYMDWEGGREEGFGELRETSLRSKLDIQKLESRLIFWGSLRSFRESLKSGELSLVRRFLGKWNINGTRMKCRLISI